MKIATMMPEASKPTGNTAQVRARPQSNETRAGAAAPGHDRVDVSADARALASAMQDVTSTSPSDGPDRAAHIEKLRAAVASGTYQVDAHALANAIVDDAIDVARSTTRARGR